MMVGVHLFLLHEDQVLLLCQNTGYEDGNYSVIAGHVDGGEEIKAAMICGARAEAGIVIAPHELDVVGVMHRRSTEERIDFFLAATHWSGGITNAEPHQCADLVWFPLNRLPDTVIPYVRRALAHDRQGQWFDSVGWPAP